MAWPLQTGHDSPAACHSVGVRPRCLCPAHARVRSERARVQHLAAFVARSGRARLPVCPRIHAEINLAATGNFSNSGGGRLAAGLGHIVNVLQYCHYMSCLQFHPSVQVNCPLGQPPPLLEAVASPQHRLSSNGEPLRRCLCGEDRPRRSWQVKNSWTAEQADSTTR
jgi:hypothetical protein